MITLPPPNKRKFTAILTGCGCAVTSACILFITPVLYKFILKHETEITRIWIEWMPDYFQDKPLLVGLLISAVMAVGYIIGDQLIRWVYSYREE